MKKNTYIALSIALLFLASVFFAVLYADKKFEESGQAVKLGIEWKSDKVEALELRYAKTIEILRATNNDLTTASVANLKMQEEKDSIVVQNNMTIKRLERQLKQSHEKIDSLNAVISNIRQSGI